MLYTRYRLPSSFSFCCNLHAIVVVVIFVYLFSPYRVVAFQYTPVHEDTDISTILS